MKRNRLKTLSRMLEGSDLQHQYAAKHGIESASILTVTDDETAGLIAASLAPRITGKTVIDIGGGIGLLAFHLGDYATRVYCLEANPVWAGSFLALLYTRKPKHVSYLFGSADEFAGQIHADIALFCSHSGIPSLAAVARQFAPVVIDVYGEMLASTPDRFDPLARTLRPFA